MQDFRFNKYQCKAHSISEAADYREHYRNMDWKERLRVAAYLNSVAYQYDPANPPVMDKQAFHVKSLSK